MTPPPAPPERRRSAPRICDTRRLQRFTPGSGFCNVLLRAPHDGRGRRTAQAGSGRRGTRCRRVPEHGVQRLQPAGAAVARAAGARAAHRGRARLRRPRPRRTQPAQRPRRRDRRRVPAQPCLRVRRARDHRAPARRVRRHRPAAARAVAGARPAAAGSGDRAGGGQRGRRRPDRVLDGRRRSAVPRRARAAAADRDRGFARRRGRGGDRRARDRRPGLHRDRRPGCRGDRRAPPARPRASPPRRPELRPHRPLAAGPGRSPRSGGGRGQRAEGAARRLGPRGRGRRPGVVGVPVELVPVTSADGCLAGARALLDRAPGVTAVFAFSDPLALAVWQAARERGLSVPGDLSIVGFDDTAPAGEGLTRIHQPLRDKGRIAAERLLGALGEDRHPAGASCCPRGSWSAARPLSRLPRSRPRSAACSPRTRPG